MTSPIWRHLTHPDGMTVSLLVKATGMTVKEVRADLRALEANGKAIRETAAPGKEHLWWRRGSQPLDELTVVLALNLARRLHANPGKLRSVMRSISTRAAHPAWRQSLALASTALNTSKLIDVFNAEYEAAQAKEAA